MEWVSVKDRLPKCMDKDMDYSVYVLVTDGELIEIANYIYKPRTYGCAVDDDAYKATCGPQPHWHFLDEVGSFKSSDLCFGRIETNEVTHWMPLPEPPSIDEK